jgi:hypothetical protein
MPEEKFEFEEQSVKPTMTDEEFQAVGVVANYLAKFLKKIDAQNNPNYPYMNATCVDLFRMYGQEAFARSEKK